jgi:Xaa-Pro aminopeptidase
MALVYEKLEAQLQKTTRLFYTMGVDELMDRSLARIFERNVAFDYRGNPSAHPVVRDPAPVIATSRLIKDSLEIGALERAAKVTAAGHCRAMEAAAPGQMEYELQAEVEAAFRRMGSKRNGYESIVASGANACVLHYVDNDRRMKNGDLVLIDAGAEVDLYTADVTRTFPVSGRFSEAQAAVYRIVLKAQKAAIRAARAGRAWNAPHAAAVRATVDGLLDLGIVRGRRKELVAKEAHRPWFMHGTSHWLGMDVHDVGGYEEPDGKPMKLRAGMVLTIEPGLYFGARDRSVPKEYRGIGVRIEDDVLVTRSGNRVLTDGVPKELHDIQTLCQRPDSQPVGR